MDSRQPRQPSQPWQIAVLGTGMVGRAVATRLAALHHHVVVGTRDPDATRAREEWPAELPLATYADAASGADLVVNATSGAVTLQVLSLAGAESLAGKPLLDIANPLDFSQGFPPTLSVKDSDSLAEQVQRAYPDALVVKALNTMNADLMVDPRRLAEGDHTVFVSGDDAAAKARVTDLLEQIGHRDVLDLGALETARGTEMLLPLWLRIMQALGTSGFQLKVVRPEPDPGPA